MSSPWPYRQTRELLMNYLHGHQFGSFAEVASGVVQLAEEKGLFHYPKQNYVVAGQDYRTHLSRDDQANVTELLRQLFWELLVKGIIVFGHSEFDGNFPLYRVTGIGDKILDGQSIQPYDPDNFIALFRSKVPKADPVIIDYFDEATRALNSDCIKSCFVMMGCCSEKAILILHETFENAITDSTKKKAYQSATNWMVSTKFQVLKDRLDHMVAAKKFPGKAMKDMIASTLPGAFELIRRLRNSNGHPELYTGANPDEAFLTLRILPEYISNIYVLVDYFSKNPADW